MLSLSVRRARIWANSDRIWFYAARRKLVLNDTSWVLEDLLLYIVCMR